MEILNTVLLIALLVISVRLFGPRCRKCHTLAVVFRIPKNGNEAWGGWTCTECGCESNRWGEPVEMLHSSDRWSARIDETHAPPCDLLKSLTTDIQRGDYHE